MSNDNKRTPGQQQPHNPSQGQSREKQRQDQGTPMNDQKNKNPQQDRNKERK